MLKRWLAGLSLLLVLSVPVAAQVIVISQSGVGGGGSDNQTAAEVPFTPGGTISSTNVQTAIGELDTEKIATSQINAANGVVGANANGRVSFTGAGDFAAHAPLAASGTITPTQPTMGIEGSGGPVKLTSNPNIAPGSYHGQRLTFKGLHPTNTVTLEDESIDAGSGNHLCGRTGSVIVGLGKDDLNVEWNSTLSVYQELGCQTLQRVANLGNTIDLVGTQLKLRDGTSGFDFKVTAGKPSIQCLASGGDCDNEFVVPAGKVGSFFSNADEIARITETTDSWDFLAGHLHLRGGTGAPTAGDCDAAGEARRVWVQTDAADTARMTWLCRGVAGWAQQGGGSVSDLSVQVTRSAVQSIPNATNTAIAFTAENFDTNSFHDNVTNNNRVTFVSAGKYAGLCQVRFAPNATGEREATLRKNGTLSLANDVRPTTGAGNATSIQTGTMNNFAANDYVELLVYQTSGGSLDIEFGSDYSPVCTFWRVN